MLNLLDMKLVNETATLRYEVIHNVAALRTNLEFPLELNVNTRTGKVAGSLTLDELEAPTLNLAISKMATWCERMGAALRAVRRQPDCEFPLFERTRFELETAPAWQQVLYADVLENLRSRPDDEISGYYNELSAANHPLVLISGALDAARATVEREREESTSAPE